MKFTAEFIKGQRELIDKSTFTHLEALGNYPDALDEIERLRKVLAGLMKFHPEDECGPTTEEYWMPEYKAAMDAARAALKGGEE